MNSFDADRRGQCAFVSVCVCVSVFPQNQSYVSVDINVLCLGSVARLVRAVNVLQRVAADTLKQQDTGPHT